MVASAWVRDLWAPDEPRYAQVAREAYQGSSFLVMHLCGRVYPDKPPLLFWISGLFGWLSGWSEFWMRVPSLAATLGSALLIGRLARRWWGREVAPWASAIFLSTSMVTEIGGRLQIDPLLCVLCLLAVDLVSRPADRPADRAGHLLLAGCCVGLGGLAKGPVAAVNVGLVLLAWRWLGPEDDQPKVGVVIWLTAAALAVLPGVVWALLVVAAEPAIAQDIFYDQHLGRVIAADRHPGPPWKSVVRLPLLLLPWTGAVVGGLIDGLRAWKQRTAVTQRRPLLRVALWFAVLVVFYSIIPPKRDLYLLFAYPAAALLGGWFIANRTDGRRVSPWVTAPGPIALAAAGLALSAAPWLTDVVPGFGWQGPVVGGLTVTGAIWTLVVWRSRGLSSWGSALVTTWLVCTTSAAATLLGLANPVKSARRVAREIAAREERPSEIPCFGVRPEGYRFYGKGRVPTAPGRDLAGALDRERADFLALVRRDRWLEIDPWLASQLRVVAEYRVGGKELVLVGRREVQTEF
jgi:4-amino-4-deoxy-L-arabinose transferase-like glycosyltransferase